MEWTKNDYVGLATYRSIKMLPIEKLQAHLFLAHYGKYDIVPLMNFGEPLMKQAIEGHEIEFREVWDALLNALGYSMERIRELDDIEVFLRNSFIAKPAWMKTACRFMTKAMKTTVANGSVLSLMQRNAHYGSATPKVAMKIFKTTYYQWHPFIFERLPVFYFYASNASIYKTVYKRR
jgi:hypothetical protein